MIGTWRNMSMSVGAGALCVLLTATYVVQGLAPAQVIARANQLKVPLFPGARAALPEGLDSTIVQAAVKAAPLDQSVFDGVMLDAVVRDPGTDLSPWLKALNRLGWRDVTAVQNIMGDAVRRQDVQALIDPADALLRQNKLVIETTNFMNLAEAYPPTWPRVFALLRSHVKWRYQYLERAGTMTAPEVLDGRIRTLRTLLASGDTLAAQEVRPFVVALINAGRVAEADGLWRQYTRDRSNLIHDPAFREVLAIGTNPVTIHPLQWTINEGYGFSADVASDGLSNALVSLRWDGRGVPVFLSQTTSAKPGHQRLTVKVEGDPRAFADRIGFRLRCGNDLVEFEPVRSPGRLDLLLQTASPVACAFPIIEVFGKVQKSQRAYDGALSTISMRPASGAAPVAVEPTRNPGASA